MDAVFSRPMPTGPTDLPSPRSPPTAPNCWAMTRSRRAPPRHGSGTAHRRANPRCSRRISLEWCSPGSTAHRGGVSASASSRCRRWSCTAARTHSSRSATARRSPTRSPPRGCSSSRHGHRPAGRRGRRGHRRDARLLTPPPDRPAAAGTLRLADLDAGNGRFRRRAMQPQPSDRPSRSRPTVTGSAPRYPGGWQYVRLYARSPARRPRSQGSTTLPKDPGNARLGCQLGGRSIPRRDRTA